MNLRIVIKKKLIVFLAPLAHSRKAAVQEVQRLKIENCLRPRDAPNECGRVSVKDIVLPLSEDYVRKGKSSDWSNTSSTIRMTH